MATIGIGAQVAYEAGSSWTQIVNPKNVTFPELAIGSVDTTNLSSPNYGKEYMPGLIDGNSITFDCEYSQDQYSALATMALNRTVGGWEVTGPPDEPGVVTCDGFVTKLGVPFTVDGEVMINVEVKMTGVPVIS